MWTEWVRVVSGGASARQIAARIHRSHSSVARWVRDDGVPAEVVIEIARAYDADPVEGLVAAGHLSVGEIVPHLRNVLKYTPQTYLTEELHRRSRVWEAATMQGESFTPWFAMPPEIEAAGPVTEELRLRG